MMPVASRSRDPPFKTHWLAKVCRVDWYQLSDRSLSASRAVAKCLRRVCWRMKAGLRAMVPPYRVGLKTNPVPLPSWPSTFAGWAIVASGSELCGFHRPSTPPTAPIGPGTARGGVAQRGRGHSNRVRAPLRGAIQQTRQQRTRPKPEASRRCRRAGRLGAFPRTGCPWIGSRPIKSPGRAWQRAQRILPNEFAFREVGEERSTSVIGQKTSSDSRNLRSGRNSGSTLGTSKRRVIARRHLWQNGRNLVTACGHPAQLLFEFDYLALQLFSLPFQLVTREVVHPAQFYASNGRGHSGAEWSRQRCALTLVSWPIVADTPRLR
jgi:hypothetical protein